MRFSHDQRAFLQNRKKADKVTSRKILHSQPQKSFWCLESCWSTRRLTDSCYPLLIVCMRMCMCSWKSKSRKMGITWVHLRGLVVSEMFTAVTWGPEVVPHYSTNSLINCDLFNLASLFASALIFFTACCDNSALFLVEVGALLCSFQTACGTISDYSICEILIINSTGCTVRELWQTSSLAIKMHSCQQSLSINSIMLHSFRHGIFSGMLLFWKANLI